MMFTKVKNEDLKVGDVIRLWCGTKTITKITPYNGPLCELVFALVDYEPGVGFSLTRGGYTEAMRP